MSVLGGQWTLLIARDLMNGINKFDNIQRSLKISRNLLTQRLLQMEHDGLANKVVPEGLKRAIYQPTQKCFDLMNILLALSEWSEKWMPDPNGPRITVKSPKSGKKLQLALLPADKIEKHSHKSINICYGVENKAKIL